MKTFIKSFAIIFVLFFGSCLYILSNHIGGWRAFVVQTGSMVPTISIGSLVITQKSSATDLKQGDIITFLEPEKQPEFITHRIAKITKNKGFLTFKTKGDYNRSMDSWTLAQ